MTNRVFTLCFSIALWATEVFTQNPAVTVNQCRIFERRQSPQPPPPTPPCDPNNVTCLDTFPANFQWGVASSAYQIEGAWNVDGKSPSIWDNFTQQVPSPIVDNSTGNDADLSYTLYPRDVQMVGELRAGFYLFSIAWTRILPTGDPNNVNQLGVNYYNNLINNLVANNITPVATMYHYDMIQSLQANFGGFMNQQSVEYFANYSRTCFRLFGDRVKLWITLYDPNFHAYFGYGLGVDAPGLTLDSVGPYMAGHFMLQAHARAWEIYNQEFRQTQQGRVGISIWAEWYEPLTNSTDDLAATQRALAFMNDWLINPICNTLGDYPPLMRTSVDARSQQQGLRISRLPVLTPDWIQRIRGSIDFIAVSHFVTYQVTVDNGTADNEIQRDGNFSFICMDGQPSSVLGAGVNPEGFRQLLNWVRQQCPNVPIAVSANGYASRNEGVTDVGRIAYLTAYLRALLDAIRIDGINVFAYAVSTLMDSFYWDRGYTVEYGLYAVDFNSTARTRTPKLSASTYRSIIQRNGFTKKKRLTPNRFKKPGRP